MVLLAPLWGELNHPDWEVRQQADSKHNMLSALLLVPDNDDPETRIRAIAIRKRLIRHISPQYIERLLMRDDPDKWLENHVVNGVSSLMSPKQLFLFLRTENLDRNSQFKPLLDRFRNNYPPPFYTTGYLFGMIHNGEWEMWQLHLRHYDNRSRGHAAFMGGFWFATK